MSLEQELTASAQANRQLHATVLGQAQDWESRMLGVEQRGDDAIAKHQVQGLSTLHNVYNVGGWDRLLKVSVRQPFELVINIVGGNFSPSSLVVHLLPGYVQDLEVKTISKLGAQAYTQIRMTSDNSSIGYIEVFGLMRNQVHEVVVRPLALPMSTLEIINAGINLPLLSVTTSGVLL